MLKRLPVACALLLCSCSSLIPVGMTTPTDACVRADDNYLIWNSVSIASAGLAGATGASGVLTATLADEPNADIAMAASSAVLGVLATVASVLAGEYAERSAAACTEPTVP